MPNPFSSFFGRRAKRQAAVIESGTRELRPSREVETIFDNDGGAYFPVDSNTDFGDSSERNVQ